MKRFLRIIPLTILFSLSILFAGPSSVFALSQCCLCKSASNATQNVCATVSDVPLGYQCKTILIDGLDCASVTFERILSPKECQPVASGGLCHDSFSGSLMTKGLKYTPPKTEPTEAPQDAKTEAKTIEIEAPKLNVEIPGLTFASNLTYKEGEKVAIPFLAQYLAAVYNYLLGIVLITAAVMIVYGGFKYVLSSTLKGIKDGQETIKDAIIGLLIAFGIVTILQTINPQVVALHPIELQTIKRELQVVPPEQIQAVTGKSPLAAAQMRRLVAQKAKDTAGITFACFALGSMTHESGGRPDVIGHDEDARILTLVPARHAFLNSLKKWSGAKFELPEQCCVKDAKTRQEQCKPVPQTCREGKCATDEVACQMNYFGKKDLSCFKLPNACQALFEANDDKKLDLTKPPDYGMDWRFSHGFGAGQSTIFPTSGPCPGKQDKGRGFWTGGKCYTVPELFDAEKQAEVMLSHYKACWDQKKGDAAEAYKCYGSSTPELLNPRMKTYNNCVNSGDPVQFAS